MKILEDDPDDFKKNYDKYIDLTEIADNCSSYEEYQIKCDLIGVYSGGEQDWNGFKKNGGCCSRCIRPLKSYLIECGYTPDDVYYLKEK